jgi:hypothetical protein
MDQAHQHRHGPDEEGDLPRHAGDAADREQHEGRNAARNPECAPPVDGPYHLTRGGAFAARCERSLLRYHGRLPARIMIISLRSIPWRRWPVSAAPRFERDARNQPAQTGAMPWKIKGTNCNQFAPLAFGRCHSTKITPSRNHENLFLGNLFYFCATAHNPTLSITTHFRKMLQAQNPYW